MKRTKVLLSQTLLLLLVLSSMAPGASQMVEAKTGAPEEKNPLKIIWAAPGPPEDFCVGQKFKFFYKFEFWFGTEFPWLVPQASAVVKISALNKKGTIPFSEQKFPPIVQGTIYEGDFTYAATSEGEETVEITVTTNDGAYKNTLTKKFPIQKKCRASIHYKQNTKMSYEVVSIISTYGGNGELTMEDGQISGSGTQTVWSDIPPYALEGASCVHSPPWEGSSGITFSGQVGADGVVRATMELEALAISASSLTCTGADGSGSMPFPAYTYSSCQVLLAGFNFEADTLEVPFDCPGEAPYTLPITVIPRRDS